MMKDDSFVFISYSNLDEDIVNPFVEAMEEMGIRLWRDLNIKAGTEWADTLQKKLESCDRLVAFVTKNFLVSDFCFREIIYAHTSLYKEILVVCLEDVEDALRADETGIDMLLSSRQWIYRDNADNDREFVEELLKAEFFDSCREEVVLEEKLQRAASTFIASKEGKSIPTPTKESSSEKSGFYEKTADLPTFIASTISSGAKKSRIGVVTELSPSKALDISDISKIKFSCTLLTPFSEETDLPIEIKIYNVRNECVFRNFNNRSFSPKTREFHFEWDIKNEKGYDIFEEGQYCAIISAEGFREFKYNFSLVNTHPYAKKKEEELDELKKRVSHHRLMMLKLAIWGMWILFALSFELRSLAFVVMIGSIIGMIILQRKVFIGFLETYTKNKFIAFIVVIPLGFFYGIYQVCMGLTYLPTYKKDLESLKELT